MSAYAIYAKDVDGSPCIPPSQRPDGTWRKQRRVKEGYVPQEEVPLYESKGRQFAKNKPQYPVGMTPPPINNASPNLNLPLTKRCPIPGLVIDEDYMKKIKNKKKTSANSGTNNATSNVERITNKLSQTSLKENSAKKPTSPAQKQQQQSAAATDPAKRLKNLKKKLREIESIEQRMKSGEIKNPEKEQLEKVSRKKEVLDEIEKLEKFVQ